MRNYQEYTIWDDITPVAIDSSTDATPIVITTSTDHGLATGDLVMIYGHSTNVAANGLYKVTVLSDTTFSIQNRNSGADIAGSGGGAGSGGIMMPMPNSIPYTMDFKSVVLQLITSGTATMTMKWAMSQGIPAQEVDQSYGDIPNFGATVSESNPYTFGVLQDLSNGASLPGATGVVVAGTDFQKNYEAWVQGMKYCLPIITSWSQGSISLKLLGYYE